MKLLIGNKNYSSWSMRPWLVLRHFAIPFDEEILLLNGEGWKQNLIERTPFGSVPVLEDGALVLGESLAIVEYVAERFPDKAIWPADSGERAKARQASARMHAGFASLRNSAPMNIRASYLGRISADELGGDIEDLESLLGGLLDMSGGPFLFGAFCAADAMFGPVAYQEWCRAARAEPWVVPEDELDFVQERD